MPISCEQTAFLSGAGATQLGSSPKGYHRFGIGKDPLASLLSEEGHKGSAERERQADDKVTPLNTVVRHEIFESNERYVTIQFPRHTVAANCSIWCFVDEAFPRSFCEDLHTRDGACHTLSAFVRHVVARGSVAGERSNRSYRAHRTRVEYSGVEPDECLHRIEHATNRRVHSSRRSQDVVNY